MADEESPDEFLFPGPIWFAAPSSGTLDSPPFHDLDEVCLTVLKGVFRDGETGRMVPIVYAFSDEDLAGRFLGNGGPAAAPYRPYTPGGDAALLALLERLQAHGHHTLGVDVEPGSGVLCRTAAAARQVRGRQGG